MAEVDWAAGSAQYAEAPMMQILSVCHSDTDGSAPCFVFPWSLPAMTFVASLVHLACSREPGREIPHHWHYFVVMH